MPRRPPIKRTECSEAHSLAGVLQEALTPGMLALDEHQRIVCCTAEAERLLGLPAALAPDRQLAVLPVAVRKIIREAFATRRAVASHVVALKTGKDAPLVRLEACPIQTREAGAGMVVMISDVAAARRLEQHLHRLDRLANIGLLSAGLGHEIKNALVGVKTFVELLLEKNRDAELAETVGRELKRMEALVSQMLRFRTRSRPTVSLLHVHDVMEHSLRVLQHQFETKPITVHRQFNAACDTVKGDDYQLEQAFVNLFLNAIEAMGPNGTLTITSENLPYSSPAQGAARLCVTIADDGIGISPEHQARLFEPFFTTKQHGTGLGLAITRRILMEHRGEITGQSKPNRGARFSILLPTVMAR